MTRKVSLIAVGLLFTALTVTHATVSVTSLYSTNMVLQRDKPVPVWGTAAASKTITVVYNGQTKTTTSDAQGNWLLYLDAMAAKTTGSNMTVNESGANTLTFTNVVVGDVWICSGQSNMAFGLSGCNRQTEDIRHRKLPRHSAFLGAAGHLRGPIENCHRQLDGVQPQHRRRLFGRGVLLWKKDLHRPEFDYPYRPYCLYSRWNVHRPVAGSGRRARTFRS